MKIILRTLAWTPYTIILMVVVLAVIALASALSPPVMQLFQGGVIVFVSETSRGSHEIYQMDVNSSERRRLSRLTVDSVLPNISPDGRHIVFLAHTEASDYGWFIMPSYGDQLALLKEGVRDDNELIWSPDSQQVAFVASGNRIWIADITGDNQREIARGKLGDWSPTGRQIVYIQNHGDLNWEIYVLDLETESSLRLTENDATDIQPVWSPDGRLIAFVSNRDGNNEIYVMDADGGNQRRLTWNRGEDTLPVWMP